MVQTWKYAKGRCHESIRWRIKEGNSSLSRHVEWNLLFLLTGYIFGFIIIYCWVFQNTVIRDFALRLSRRCPPQRTFRSLSRDSAISMKSWKTTLQLHGWWGTPVPSIYRNQVMVIQRTAWQFRTARFLERTFPVVTRLLVLPKIHHSWLPLTEPVAFIYRNHHRHLLVQGCDVDSLTTRLKWINS